MAAELSGAQRQTLRAICDTVVPSIPREPDPDGFWARCGQRRRRRPGPRRADLRPAPGAALRDAPAPRRPRRSGVRERLAALAGADPAQHLPARRPRRPRGSGRWSPAASSSPTRSPTRRTGQNPFWKTFGYPGPIAAPSSAPKPLQPLVPEGDELELEADVGRCRVRRRRRRDRRRPRRRRAPKVVVLEAGGYFDESDFNMLELWAYQNLYYRGGPVPTIDGNVSMQAGAGLGGGTTINWTNCLRTTPWVREQWAREYGLEGVDGPDYDRHLDAVLERIGANDELQRLQRPDPADEGGRREPRLVLRARRPQRRPGHLQPRDRRLHGLRRHQRLEDEHRQDLPRRRRRRRGGDPGADRGSAGSWSRAAAQPGSRRATRIPRAGAPPRSPSALPRSSSPAARWSRRRCCCAPRSAGRRWARTCGCIPARRCSATTSRISASWWGAPHTGVVDEFADTGDGWGFLIETAQYTTGIGASALPFTTAEAHKAAMEQYAHGATSIALLRDRGSGRVTIDADGQAMHSYALRRRGRRRQRAGTGSRPRRGSTRPPGRSRSARSPPARRPGGAGTTSSSSSPAPSGRRWDSAGTASSPPTRWAAAGWGTTRRRASPAPGASCTTPPGSGSATPAPSRPPPAPTR